jgi:hypothetical protein
VINEETITRNKGRDRRKVEKEEKKEEEKEQQENDLLILWDSE